MEKYILKNNNNSKLVSDLLEVIKDISIKEGYECEIEKGIIQGEKCDVINTIAIAVSSTLISDFIKYALAKIKERADYNQKEKININGKEKELKDLE